LAGIDFPLHDDDEEGEVEEEEELAEEEEEEEEEEVQGIREDRKIFHLPQDIFTSFCYVVCFLHGLPPPPAQITHRV